MNIAGPKYGVEVLRSLASVSRSLLLAAQQLSHELIKELARLNSARIGNDELSRLAMRDRTHAVKAALAAHHGGSWRCC
jgi:pilus assembly protein TadC